MTRKIAIVSSHPIQYQAPLFRALARVVDLRVFYAHRQDASQQAAAGYGVPFDWDVDVITGFESEFLRNVSPRPGVDAFRAADTPDVAPRLREWRPDAVLAMGWNLKCYWQAMSAARGIGALRLVRGDSQLQTPRSPLARAAKRMLYPLLLARFDRFLPVGSRSREYLLHYGVAADRCFICPHTVDLDRFFAASSRAESDRNGLRAKFGAGENDLVLAFVGRFVPWKRPCQMVEAVARLPNRDRIVCLFVGSGEEESSIREVALRESVRVSFRGFVNQSDMPRTLAAADALVLPSNGRETWGLVANEALASGTPVIASDEAGCAVDLAELGDVCHVYRGGDIAALAKALGSHTAGRTPSSAKRCQDAARSFAPEVSARAVAASIGA